MTDLSGVAVATVTPFEPGDFGLNLDYIAAHLHKLKEEGADGIVPVGTNGEFPSLTLAEKKKVLSAAAKEKGSLYLIAGVGSCSIQETIELTDYAAEAGAEAVLAVPPFYFKDVASRGIVDFYRQVLDKIELPLYLYNIPMYTGFSISDDIIEELNGHPNLAGVKDSGGDPERTYELVNRFPGLKIFGGSDSQVGRALAAGCAGVISGVANIYPAMLKDAWDANRRGGDLMEAAGKVRAVRSVLKSFPWIAATKYCLELRGLPEIAVRPPLTGLDREQKQQLESRMHELGLF